MTESADRWGIPVDYLPARTDGVAAEAGDAVRRLIDALVLTDASEDQLRTIIGAIDALSDQLEDAGLKVAMPWPPMDERGRGDRPHSPVVGPANPIAPPMPVQVVADGSIESHLTMRPVHEGPPGAVHGGWVAALFDQLLGTATIASGHGAFTAELNVRYRRPTPIGVPLVLRARIDSVEGREVRASGEITADGVVTAQAHGRFVRPNPERLAQLSRIHAELS